MISALLFSLMGPLVVGLVSLAPGIKGSGGAVLVGLMSVFTLVAAFSGGMNVAMDTVAGERERRSLLPLLLNAVDRRDVVVGKWLADWIAGGAPGSDLSAFAPDRFAAGATVEPERNVV